MDHATGAINYVDAQQAKGGTSYTSAVSHVMSNWGTLPAADKNFVYFITDGDPDSGQGVDATQSTNWKNHLTSNNVDAAFAIRIGSGSTTNIDPLVRTGTGTKDQAIVITNPADLIDTLLSTIDDGIVLGNVSILSGSGSTSGMILGADGGHLQSVTVDGIVYTSLLAVINR